jgi:hypothetical protein
MPGEPMSIIDEAVVYRNDALRIVEQAGRPGMATLAVSRGLIALVRTYRYPIAEYEWAIPRGFARVADPRRSVAGDLADHLGAEPASLEDLAVVTPHSGLVTTRVHIFLARYDTPVQPEPVRHRPATVRWEPLEQLRAEIRIGKITDGHTLAALGAALIQGIML